MSVVNRMLRDLDRRNAARPDGDAASLAAGVRPVPARRVIVGSEGFWRLMAVLMAVTVLWVAWVIWQLMPRSVVDRSVLESTIARGLFLRPSQPITPPAPPEIDMLSFTRELGAPPAVARAPAGPAKVQPVPAPARPTTQAPQPTAGAAARSSEPQGGVGVPRIDEAAPSTESRPSVVERSTPATDRQRAARAHRRGLLLYAQGRKAEAIDALAASLELNPHEEAVRQDLASALIESARYDEASRVLAEGLMLRSSNVPFAMQLARIHVERGDGESALQVLETHAPWGASNAGFRSFRAALYQRAGRHEEAAREYDIALRLTPGVGAWWIGRGISLEALGRHDEAAASYRRATLVGDLDADLAAFADQRIALLNR